MTALRFGFSSLALAVVFGAFGAHFLRDQLSANSLAAWQTAVLYQFIHSMGIILTYALQSTSYPLGKWQVWINRLLISGILAFSGSIYVLSTQSLHGLNVHFLGPITPLGGMCFIAAWTLAAVTCAKKITS